MLTDEEINDLWNTIGGDYSSFARDIERAVLKKMGEQCGGDATGKSAQDYAIEHAEYMATSAEQLLNHLNECTNIEDGVIEPDENFSDYTSGLRLGIHDFRKRRDRAAVANPLPAQAVPDGISIDDNLKRLALDYVRCGIGANYSRESFEDRMDEIYYPFRKIIDLIPISAAPKP